MSLGSGIVRPKQNSGKSGNLMNVYDSIKRWKFHMFVFISSILSANSSHSNIKIGMNFNNAQYINLNAHDPNTSNCRVPGTSRIRLVSKNALHNVIHIIALL